MSFGKRRALPGTGAQVSIGPLAQPSVELTANPADASNTFDVSGVSLSEEDHVLGDAYIGKSVVALHIMDAKERLLEVGETLQGAFHGSALARDDYGNSVSYKGGFSLHDYLLVTDQRVVMWARGIFKQSVDAFYYEDISSVEATSGLLLGEIVLNIRGARERFANMITDDTPHAERMIRANIRSHRNGRAAPPNAPQRTGLQGMFDNLERLAELKEKGLITEDEFAAKRQKIIDEI